MPPVISKGVIINNNSPIGVPAGGTEDQILAKDSNTNFDCKWVNPPTSYVAPYKVYSALLSQSGTDAPVATVLQNTLGFNLVWSYTSLGRYTATTSDSTEFNQLKTTLSLSNNTLDFQTIVHGPDLDQLRVSTFTKDYSLVGGVLLSSITFANDRLANTFIEIRVYP